jgi:hypothetical protein
MEVSCILIELHESTAQTVWFKSAFPAPGSVLQSWGQTLMRIHILPLSVLFNLNLQLDVLDAFENTLRRVGRVGETGHQREHPARSLEEEGPATYFFGVGLVRNMHSF